MSFPRYPSYKPSGVEWLGEVPEHWVVGPIKRLIQKVESGTSVNASDEPAEGGKLGVLKTSCVYTGTFDPNENKTVVDEDIGRVSCPLKAGTLIVSRMNTPELIGAAGLVTQTRDNLYLPDRLWQVSFSNADPHFVHYWTLTSLYRGQVKAVCTGTSSSMKNLGQDQFGVFSFAAPPVAEQSAIAEFLDRETGKIDALVAEQRRLMELLKEKRQAVISHAVTQGLPPEASAKVGLNPKAPMKDSGIEWLGKVPKHWKAVQVKHLAKPGKKTFTDGDWIEAPYLTDEGVRLIQTGNVGIGFYKEQGYRYVSEETFEKLNCTEFQPGDVLICRLDGPVGRACLAPDLGVRMITSVDNAILKCTDHVMPEYVVAILSSVPWISWIDALCRVDGGFRLRISRSQLGEIRVPLPPHEEQLAIVAHLKSVTASFDTLTAEAQRAIDLLQERRTALISAAVTGQIDVRT